VLRKRPEMRNLPVIVLTAKAYADDGSMAQELWGATIVGKPFEPRRLREAVNQILEDAACPKPA